jgi:hypothetical protein
MHGMFCRTVKFVAAVTVVAGSVAPSKHAVSHTAAPRGAWASQDAT